MKAMTQLEAAEAGLTTYLSKTPCKRGHEPIRYTVSGSCVECQRINCARNRDRIRALRERARTASTAGD